MHYTDPQLISMKAQHEAGVPLASLTIPPAPIKKCRKNEESECQRKVIRWWRMACREFQVPEILLCSIPNGGGGGAKRGHWLNLEGSRKGAPDIMLFWGGSGIESPTIPGCTAANRDYHGLALEFKTAIGRTTAEQQTFHQHLRSAGYRVEIVRSFDQAVEVISGYLSK